MTGILSFNTYRYIYTKLGERLNRQEEGASLSPRLSSGLPWDVDPTFGNATICVQLPELSAQQVRYYDRLATLRRNVACTLWRLHRDANHSYLCIHGTIGSANFLALALESGKADGDYTSKGLNLWVPESFYDDADLMPTILVRLQRDKRAEYESELCDELYDLMTHLAVVHGYTPFT